jgi:hypothetical protein
MKKLIKKIAVLVFVIACQDALAYNDKEKSNKGGGEPIYNKAGCAPSRATLDIAYNDVKARIEPGGFLFNDRSTGLPAYEVPRNGGVHSIYAGALWMGGTSVDGQLKLAAQLFRQGTDFWPGPLSVTAGSGNYDPRFPVGDNARRDFGAGTITPAVCSAFDKFFEIEKAQVILYSSWWECQPGNVIPAPDNCEDVQTPSNDVLNRINNWPAHGNVSEGQDYYLAPFYDRNNDGSYNPDDGDTPWYDDIMGRDDIECQADRRISLFGDKTVWWIFNDKGNIHTETNGDPIGMEIRAQAFAFNTNDEVNKMTFYNYELINRGTQTLTNTYFAKYVDTDLGNYSDDYVGCDVTRGLGYCYNGDAEDQAQGASKGYGINPPAIGVDFFEGPYQDADGIDNPGPRYVTEDGIQKFVVPSLAEALAQNGIVYKGLGIGYSDNVIDNERLGMKGFTYFSSQGGAQTGDPATAAQFYNYMVGRWRDGNPLFYGGTGYQGSNGGTNIRSSYMFPSDSDSLLWATKGENPGFDWDENTSNNPPGDRRFVQAAGPFTLKPGAVNNITVGVIWARSTESDLFASVRLLKAADTKAQALFDNCFKIFDPPSAPRLTIQELKNELVLMLDNPNEKFNPIEGYRAIDDINIPGPESGFNYDRFYVFEGYQIYQVLNDQISAAEIGDNSKARLIMQFDIKNTISEIINFEFDDDLGYSIPVRRAEGNFNKGIQHSFPVTQDAFSTGDVKTLVNHKTYHFIAISYAYNNYKDFDPNDPTKLDGQKFKYVSSRNSYDLGPIRSVPATPHDPRVEAGGTNFKNVKYGDSPEITRYDGRGNGNLATDLVQTAIDQIVKDGKADAITYAKNAGPIKVKVVDPLNVAPGYFELKFRNYVNEEPNEAKNGKGIDTASWVVYRYDKKGGTILDSISSDRTISRNKSIEDSVSIIKPDNITVTTPQSPYSNEQLVPEWGVSIQIYQERYFRNGETSTAQYDRRYANPIEATVTFSDSTENWLSFIPDGNNDDVTNWIRSGNREPVAADCNAEEKYTNPCLYKDEVGIDYEDQYSKLLGGGIAPWRLVGYQGSFMPFKDPKYVANDANPPSQSTQMTQAKLRNAIHKLPSIDIVFTTDTKKWTRCPVIELGTDVTLNIGDAPAGTLRRSLNVGKNGLPDGSIYVVGSDTIRYGLGWFPGYAIDVETGVRLHMAFGENSFLGKDNGADMLWNPTSNFGDPTSAPILGGQHAIYVFGYNISGDADATRNSPYYDPKTVYNEDTKVTDSWVYNKYVSASNNDYVDLFSNLSWVCNPLLTFGKELLKSEAKIRVRVNKEYNDYVATNLNGGKPMYGWSMDDLATTIGSADVLKGALDVINVVPNPYYAFSEYERNRLDTRVKITNLPDVCTIKIYNVSGKLIRTFKKDSPVTSIDWDMKNSKAIPIASGVYLIHIEVPDVGERILKFFGGVRQIDLESI